MVVPHVLGRTAYPRPGCCFLTRTSPDPPRKTADRLSAAQSRWIRPSFSRALKIDARIDLVPPCPDKTHPGCSVHASNTTPQLLPNLSGPFFAFQNRLDFRAQKPSPATDPAGGVVILEPFWERPAGTQTHSRRTEERLGRLRYARQGLVRVSESNTKYGGKRRKTGVSAAPVIDPSISESKRIPKQKKCSGRVDFRFAPCSQGNFF